MAQALAIFGIANDAGSTILCYAVARPVRGAGEYPQSRPLAASPQDGVNRASIDEFPDLTFVAWDKIYEDSDFGAIETDFRTGRFVVPSGCPIAKGAVLTGTPFGPAILRLKSQEPIRATGVGAIRVSGLTLFGGVDSVIGWLKDQVGDAKTTGALIKLIDWIEEQAGLPSFFKDRPRIGLIDFLSRRQTGLAADGLLFHVSLDPPKFRERTPLNKVHIKRHAADIGRGFYLHIVIQNFDDVIRDGLLHIAPGQREITIEAPTHVTDVELSVFGDGGEIVDFVSGAFTQGMSFGVSAIGASDGEYQKFCVRAG